MYENILTLWASETREFADAGVVLVLNRKSRGTVKIIDSVVNRVIETRISLLLAVPSPFRYDWRQEN